MRRRARPGPLTAEDILAAYQQGQGPSLSAWVPWTYSVTGAGGFVGPLGCKTVPRGTLLLSSSGALPTAASRAGVQAPYGPMGSPQDLGLPWVARGQAVELYWGGFVAPGLTLTGTAQVVVDWHEGPPGEWVVDLVVTPTGLPLPPWSVDLVWQPDAPGRVLDFPGSSGSPVSLAETPAQLVGIPPDALSVHIDAGNALLKVRCRR